MEASVTRLDRRLRAKDLDALPHDWDTRYELIGGVLHMSTRPSHRHQQTIMRLSIKVGPAVLAAGGDAVPEAGIVWDDEGDDNVAVDFAILLHRSPPPPGRKLDVCPDIVAEVLSPGVENERRDVEAKRELYLQRGALEYWILDPDRCTVLRLVRGPEGWIEERLGPDDRLAIPLLPLWPGVVVRELFPG